MNFHLWVKGGENEEVHAEKRPSGCFTAQAILQSCLICPGVSPKKKVLSPSMTW